jgi:pleckstrin domain-containing family G protein 5
MFFSHQIASVDRFVHHVNSTLHQQHEEEKLQAIVDKIETYDAVDAPNDECLKVKLYSLVPALLGYYNK